MRFCPLDFLMQYVKKDKLTELLAEKLCARLVASESARQGQLISYCLGQLKVRFLLADGTLMRMKAKCQQKMRNCKLVVLAS